ncbi:MAG: hypothetical protein B6240_05545 [Desulfobacteraceae bacterium 4572_87]|nr:MAG: hypothetical protein B6240_05545 [Desulfobacteraceae bacterium 4572_87]
MVEKKDNQGQAWIKNQVMDQGLCTGCAACVGLCPYQKFYRDQTAIIHECDRTWGRCAAYCPRGQVDLNGLRKAMFAPVDLTPELGAVKGLYMTRASDPQMRDRAQHGGTVSTLVTLALEQGLIGTAILAGREENHRSESVSVSDPSRVASLAGSKFSVSPTVGKFNEVSQNGPSKIGVVATPCQALALARMRVCPQPGDEERVNKLELVIGLFCGWALSWRELSGLIREKVGSALVKSMDIPPSQHQVMELHTDNGIITIPMEEVQACVRDLVRTEKGQALLDLARSRGMLEFKEVPLENLSKLKAASLGKKNACAAQLEEVSGSKDDLIYTRREALLCQ